MAGTHTAVIDASRSPAELAAIVAAIAAQPDTWIERVRFRNGRRWYERLRCEADHDVWLITWLPGQSTGFHDHGPSSGAFAVASGVLEEERPGKGVGRVHAGDVRTVGASSPHDVRNRASAPAISIHAYSPPLTEMTRYELDGDDLIPSGVHATVSHEGPAQPVANRDGSGSRGVDSLLAAARSRLRRLSPAEAQAALQSGDSVLVDIRPAAQRAAEGEIPEAIVVERNVLEWRFDPQCEARLSIASGYDVQVIVICSEGYTSSLAAAALQDIGLWRSTDVVGGFHAWRSAASGSIA